MTSSAGPVLIVGAGLAGLSAATELTRAGRTVRVLEAGQQPGGRVRTTLHRGFRIDQGFQVLNTGYPQVPRMLDLTALRMGWFVAGALVRTSSGQHLLADPRRMPAATLSTLRAPVGSMADKVRLALATTSMVARPRGIRAGTPVSTLDRWRQRVGPSMLDGFVRPFLRGVLLDDDLAASSRFADLVWRSFARGRVGLPAEGMAAVPRQLADTLPAGVLDYGRRVLAVRPDGVRTADGDIEADAVILAADPVASAGLLGEAEPAMRAVTTWYHAASTPPIDRPVLVLDGERRTRIVNSAVLTNAVPSYAADGRALVATSVLGEDDTSDEDLREQLSWLYDTSADGWELITKTAVPHALPAYPPSAPMARAPRTDSGVYVAGDWRDTPSIQGALVSGRRVAQALLRHPEGRG